MPEKRPPINSGFAPPLKTTFAYYKLTQKTLPPPWGQAGAGVGWGGWLGGGGLGGLGWAGWVGWLGGGGLGGLGWLGWQGKEN